MKEPILKASAILCGLGGLLLIPTLFSNVVGSLGFKTAPWPEAVNALVIITVVGLFVLSYWLFRKGRSEA